MAEQKNKYQILLSPKQINQLTAIYEDYMYSVRQYERSLQMSSVDLLASFRMNQMYHNTAPEFPWKWDFLNSQEKQEFQNMVNDDLSQTYKNSYISLIHTNPADDDNEPIQAIPDGYNIHVIDRQLPSSVERYIIAYPKDATIGSTNFFIDKLYKATFCKKENADMPITEFFSDEKNQTEFHILINLISKAREYNYQIEDKYQRIITNLYAAETTAHWENTILELLGSFAEKTHDICHRLYGSAELQRAEQDNLIPSADNFRDYIQIRHLMRHQWDTIDDLGYFRTSTKNVEKRIGYLLSYLNLCDRTIVQRQKAYINVLHQMQHIIHQLEPDRIIRNPSESKNQFIKRLKAFKHEYPDKDLIVELNYPLESDKYKALYKDLQKVFPQIKIREEFIDNQEAFSRMEQDYSRRSWFLSAYHDLECRMMTYCLTRGEDFKNRDAWEYFRNHNLLSPKEALMWDEYKDLRNALSHNYYSPRLRQKLRDVEQEYLKHQNDLETKILELAPESKRLRHGVYLMTHKDGLCVTIDYVNRKISHSIQCPELQQFKCVGKIDLTDPKYAKHHKKQPSTETYPNGVEISTANNKIVSFKMPNNISINFEKQRISWSSDVQLHTNAEKFNLLQAGNHKLTTNKDFRVTSFFEGTHSRPIHSGDVCMMGGKHRAFIGDLEYLNAFHYKNSDGNLIKAQIRQSDTGTQIALNNGTKILLHGTDLIVAHKGKVLTYDNRQEFAATYNDAPFIPPQTIKRGNER